MNYKMRPGVVLLNICDAHLLAATRTAWEACPRLRQVPTFWSICLALMTNEKTSEDAISSLVQMFHLPEEKLRAKLSPMFQTLESEGFLVAEEDGQ